MTEKKRTFRLRPFASVMTGIAFLVAVFSGVVLYSTPTGRVAYWTGWRMLWLTKDQWGALHTVFALLFVIFGAIHLYVNWKAMVSYFKNRAGRAIGLRGEWAAALVLSVVCWVVTVYNWPPAAQIVHLNTKIKQYWDARMQPAPLPHAELMTFAQLAAELELDLKKIETNLAARGIEVAGSDLIIKDVALAHDMTPSELYEIALAQTGWRRPADITPGSGNKTLAQFCADEGLDLAQVEAKLQAAGLKYEKGMKLRELAMQNQMTPPQLFQIIKE